MSDASKRAELQEVAQRVQEITERLEEMQRELDQRAPVHPPEDDADASSRPAHP